MLINRMQDLPLLFIHRISNRTLISMSTNKLVPAISQGRPVGATEQSFCRAVPGGTGIAVVAILTTTPPETQNLQNALHKLQNAHPILRSNLHSNAAANTFFLSTSRSPTLKLTTSDLSSTLEILQHAGKHQISPFHLIVEHELNQNSWCNNGGASISVSDVFFASVYELPEGKWAVVLRLHAAACDRTTGVSLLNELVGLMGEGGRVEGEFGSEGRVNLGIEDLVPKGKGKKTMWSRGVDMIGYSLSSLKLTNLKFKDTTSPRSSQLVRFRLDQKHTERLLAGCKSRGIKLSGALGAAALIAAHSSKTRIDKQRKYAIVTLTDCRSLLNPPLTANDFGFYHSAIMNTYTMKGGEKLWDSAKKVYKEYESYKKSNKHFTDMADLNYLMCKAIENPILTSSSSLRTSMLSVFEDSNTSVVQKSEMLGFEFEEFIGCASAHGVGPSLAVFDTIRDGVLDCVCVYPSPLHSREQMQDFGDQMKEILVGACDYA